MLSQPIGSSVFRLYVLFFSIAKIKIISDNCKSMTSFLF